MEENVDEDSGDIFEEVRSDLPKTTLPHWKASVPKNVGKPGQGKLSADHWRTLATVHIPFTLARLCLAQGAKPRDKDVFKNFMKLSSAIVLACFRTTDESSAKAYTSHMKAYLEEIFSGKLYGDVKPVPNHHLALHLEEYLVRFGPSHSFWAFPFERYIGLLRQKNINNKFGESLLRPAQSRDQHIDPAS